MNSKRLVVVAFSILAMVITMSSGFAYVHQTIQTYTGACSQLPGFAGVLQRFNFVPTASCKVEADGKTCHDRAVCNITPPPTGKSGSGHCTQLKTGGSNSACVCQ